MLTPVNTRLRAWLNTIPIRDPIQQQMAALLQAVLLALMSLIVLVTLVLLMLPAASAQERSRLPVGNTRSRRA
jgi:hypothetical protein